MEAKILLDNIDKIHTTEMGVKRIKKNLQLDECDAVEYCKTKFQIKIALFISKARIGTVK